ncbi:Riboflavin kinase [Acidisarcina polymorpha]|uniref:Riboflavin biosynthesis protein n=1 Tax=Acidisarcina polymorpha TaxID=2211140 RepID=A0A2Z5FRY3_9BACT|nr:bifunctional riboflavin kinase/FAD synthetase [Acidisarcina polymorpha]AXC09460.1 Riboflavin kinase [Acidisarcina polymorpha]
MDIFRALPEIPSSFGPTVVSIGNFDGVHCAHQWLLAEISRRAHELSAKSVAVTFDPHPSRLLRPIGAPKLITPMTERLELLRASGIDATLVLPFNDELCKMSGPDFVAAVLRDALHAAEVHEGDNFRFGYRAQSQAADLIALGHDQGFRVQIFSPRYIRGIQVSSSRVREAIQSGNMTLARALLGRPFSIHSTPASGRAIGRRLTVPTINLAPYDELLPADGVYVTRMKIGEEEFDAVTNAGTRPTFGEDSYAVESYLLNFHPVNLLPETPLELTFIHRLREERKFPSPEALKHQIMQDVAKAQRYLHLADLLQNSTPPSRTGFRARISS